MFTWLLSNWLPLLLAGGLGVGLLWVQSIRNENALLKIEVAKAVELAVNNSNAFERIKREFERTSKIMETYQRAALAAEARMRALDKTVANLPKETRDLEVPWADPYLEQLCKQRIEAGGKC